MTHRLAFYATRGFVPSNESGLVIDHICNVPLCCNPEHLQAITQRENVMRGNGICAKNAAKTTCSRGHDFTPENTYSYTRKGAPRRACRKCMAENMAKLRRIRGYH